jgi:hypothetical protein
MTFSNDSYFYYGTVRANAFIRIDLSENGRVRYGTVRYGTVRYGTVRYGTLRYGTVRNVTVRYGVVDKIGLPAVKHSLLKSDALIKHFHTVPLPYRSPSLEFI